MKGSVKHLVIGLLCEALFAVILPLRLIHYEREFMNLAYYNEKFLVSIIGTLAFLLIFERIFRFEVQTHGNHQTVTIAIWYLLGFMHGLDILFSWLCRTFSLYFFWIN